MGMLTGAGSVAFDAVLEALFVVACRASTVQSAERTRLTRRNAVKEIHESRDVEVAAQVIDLMPVGADVNWRRLSRLCGGDVAQVVAALASLVHRGRVARVATGRYRRNY